MYHAKLFVCYLVKQTYKKSSNETYFVCLFVDSNEETANKVRSRGSEAHTYVCDCSSREDVYRVSAQVLREVGHVDILVNNAGIMSGKKILNLKDEEIERTMKINTLAHFWVSYICVLHRKLVSTTQLAL